MTILLIGVLSVIIFIVTFGIGASLSRKSKGLVVLLILYGVFGWWLLDTKGLPSDVPFPLLFRWGFRAQFLGVGLGAISRFFQNMFRNANAHGKRVTLLEAAGRDQWAEIDGEEYLNSKHGVRIRGLNKWIMQDFAPEFEANGGFLALDSPDGTATINVSSGPLSLLTAFTAASGDRSDFITTWVRHVTKSFEEYREKFGGDKIKRLELAELDGANEVVRLEFSTPQARVGKVCALHQGDEYVIFYLIRHKSSVNIQEILRNWKWFLRLRAGLTGLGGRSDL